MFAVWFEPTDIAKAHKFLDCRSSSAVMATSPNAREFLAMLRKEGTDAPGLFTYSSPR